ncbi:hypothetical protein [Paenibacillus sp. FSL K6-2859]|uniref:hypothetical protein n=1 Tax=Paenibacillus sp. FSL K6-2859 TaxID=2921482 RepID=UPI0030F5E92B
MLNRFATKWISIFAFALMLLILISVWMNWFLPLSFIGRSLISLEAFVIIIVLIDLALKKSKHN